MINPLDGKRLRYLIGADADGGIFIDPGAVVVLPYDFKKSVQHPLAVGYCNLFDQRDSYDKESNTGDYGPYLPQTDTAEDYDEGVIDPRGRGWGENLAEQFKQRKRQGFQYVELDNPDAYSIGDVIGAIEHAQLYGLKVVAKNPLEMGTNAARAYIAHPNVCGVIVEKRAGGAYDMDVLRRKAGRADLPVWFVSFGTGKNWARGVSSAIQTGKYQNMSVSYSARGEYETSQDI